MKKFKKIVILGAYHDLDMGDESILTICLSNFKKTYPNGQFVVLSSNPSGTLRLHGDMAEVDGSLGMYLLHGNYFVDKLRVLSLIWAPLAYLILLFNAQRMKKNTVFLNNVGKRFLMHLRSCDLLFSVGGGYIKSGRTFGSWSLWWKCLTYILCRILGKPIILSGQTIGPLRGWCDRFLTRFALDRVDVICLRDANSKFILDDLGVSKPLIMVTSDDAILLPPAEDEVINEILVKHGTSCKNPLIGINVISLPHWRGKNIDKVAELLAEFADYLVDKYSGEILFISTGYTRNWDDRVSAMAVYKLMKRKEKAIVLKDILNGRELKGVIGCLDFSIGFRFHFVLWCLSMGVPTIGIFIDDVYRSKLRGVFHSFGVNDFLYDVRRLHFDCLLKMVASNFQNKELRRELKQQAEKLKVVADLATKYACSILRSSEENPRKAPK